MNKKHEVDLFVQGLGYAAAWLVNAHDQPTIAGELLKESGFKLVAFRKACDPYDFKFIKKAWKNAPVHHITSPTTPFAKGE